MLRRALFRGMLLLVATLVFAAAAFFASGGDTKTFLGHLSTASSSLAAAVEAAVRRAQATIAQPPPAYGEGSLRVYFAPVAAGDTAGLDDALLALLRSARHSIDAALYDLEWLPAAEALIERHRAGVQVRLVTETDCADRAALRACINAGIPVVSDHRNALMHNKFIVVDGALVWSGSTNVTENGIFRNDNNAVLFGSKLLSENFSQEFLEMFDARRFGDGSPARTPYPVVKLGDIQVRTFFAPEDRAGRVIVAEIEKASVAIEFMAFSFTSKPIAEAMERRLKKGVRVRGVFETRNSKDRYCRDDALRQAGAEIYYDRNPSSMHHKAIVLDTQTVITGSYNFSSNAEERNDENLIVIDDPAIAAHYAKEFERLIQ